MVVLRKNKTFLVFLRSVGIVVLVALLAYLLSGGLLYNLELASQDVLFRLRGLLEEESNTVIVAIDEASFTQTGFQWPWPRSYIAQVVDGIAAGDPEVIAIDVLLYESSEPAEDAELARAMADAGNVILVNDITTEVRGGTTVRQLNRPIPMFDEVVTLGLTNFPRDPDGTVRRLLAFQRHNEQFFYSWSMQAARMYLGEESFTVVSPDRVDIGDHPVHLEDLYLRVNYRGEPSQTVPIYSAVQVTDGFVDPEVFRDKIVIFGATTESLHDSYTTPFAADPPMPGAEINAHAIDTILNSRYINVPSLFWQLMLTLGMAIIGMAITLRLRPVPGLLAVVALMVVFAFIAYMVFIQLRVILPLIGPVLAIGLTFVVNTSIQLYEEQRERARVRDLFDRYVAPDAIDQMLANPDTLALTGQRRELTVMFSDIRGFTSLSEKLAPAEVVAILNEYLEEMTRIIFEHEGTIDKFLGDAILAIWNAPLEVDGYTTKAARCAIAMAQRLGELQEEWAATGQVVLKTGIGIATGMCFVGNIGSRQRMDYTVIGDTVNLASRLEAFTKDIGVQILFNERTQELLDPSLKARYVTAAKIKGKEEPVQIFTVDPGTHGLEVSPDVDLEEIPEFVVQTRK